MTSDPIRDLADQIEPHIRDAFIAAVDQVRDNIDTTALIAAINASDLQAALAVLDISEGFPALENALTTNQDQNSFAELIESGFLSAAIIAAGVLSFKFKSQKTQNESVNRLNTIAASLVHESKAATQESLKRAIAVGDNLGAKLSRIIESIGLTKAQAKSLDNFRNAIAKANETNTGPRFRAAILVDGKPIREIRRNLLNTDMRGLSASQRSMIRKAINDGLTPDLAARMVERQRKAMIEHRAATVARTEAMKTVNAGEQAAWEQAASKAIIDPSKVKRFWITANDERVRSTHQSITTMNARGVGLREPFKTPFGSMMYPPAEINCRCRVVIQRNAKQ